jgi:superoxide reductase
MKTRRDFIKTSLAAAAVIAVGRPGGVSASGGSFPAGVISTKHGMSAKHFIVRHTLVGADGLVLGEKTFYPLDEKAVSTFELPAMHTSTLYATSFCNKHDFWLTEFSV